MGAFDFNAGNLGLGATGSLAVQTLKPSDGALNGADAGVSVTGHDLYLFFGGGQIELVGVTGLHASDFLFG